MVLIATSWSSTGYFFFNAPAVIDGSHSNPLYKTASANVVVFFLGPVPIFRGGVPCGGSLLRPVLGAKQCILRRASLRLHKR